MERVTSGQPNTIGLQYRTEILRGESMCLVLFLVFRCIAILTVMDANSFATYILLKDEKDNHNLFGMPFYSSELW